MNQQDAEHYLNHMRAEAARACFDAGVFLDFVPKDYDELFGDARERMEAFAWVSIEKLHLNYPTAAAVVLSETDGVKVSTASLYADTYTAINDFIRGLKSIEANVAPLAEIRENAERWMLVLKVTTGDKAAGHSEPQAVHTHGETTTHTRQDDAPPFPWSIRGWGRKSFDLCELLRKAGSGGLRSDQLKGELNHDPSKILDDWKRSNSPDKQKLAQEIKNLRDANSEGKYRLPDRYLTP